MSSTIAPTAMRPRTSENAPMLFQQPDQGYPEQNTARLVE